ncbi:ankyrin repeat domain-containing protein [Candidatus Dependentiae bacterium]|nr:ankyrin repeat domain-containing protein [Candidatus Dependentiae bacterium]
MKFFKTFAAALMLTSSLTYCMTQKDNINQQFFAAIQAGNYSLVQDLLNNGANVNAQNTQNYTPLHFAAAHGHTALAQLLIDNKAPINAQATQNFTPLHLAAQYGHTALAQLLIDNKAPINAQNTQNVTPLHCAAAQGHTALAQLLINKGADINAQTTQNDTPLHLAAKNNHTVVIEILLSYGSSILQGLLSNNAVIQAQDNRLKLSQTTNFKDIAQLLNKGAYAYPIIKAFIDIKRKQLFNAIESNDREAVAQLLKEGFTLNTCDKEGNTLLHKAIQSHNLAIIDLLISLGAGKYLYTANKQNLTPLQLLIANNMIAAVFTPRPESKTPIQVVGTKRKYQDN